MNLLVCDLGGTSCRMALAEDGQVRAASARRIRNRHFDSFEDVVAAYLKTQGGTAPEAVVVALAAPVTGDEIELTNLAWRVSRSGITRRTGVSDVHFLNDLEALGHALAAPERLNARPVQAEAQAMTGGTRLVLGVGTGFNSAARAAGGDVICSETGHTTFPVETALDNWLQSEFMRRHGRCSLERVLSGAGLNAIYRGVCALDGTAPSLSGSARIVPAALDEGDRLAVRACEEMCRILGRTAGDLALAFWARGGLWVAGGIGRALKPLLTVVDGPFARAFVAKGRMSSEMGAFPVHLLIDDNAALHGCVAWFDRRHAHARDRAVSPPHAEQERAD